MTWQELRRWDREGDRDLIVAAAAVGKEVEADFDVAILNAEVQGILLE